MNADSQSQAFSKQEFAKRAREDQRKTGTQHVKQHVTSGKKLAANFALQRRPRQLRYTAAAAGCH